MEWSVLLAHCPSCRQCRVLFSSYILIVPSKSSTSRPPHHSLDIPNSSNISNSSQKHLDAWHPDLSPAPFTDVCKKGKGFVCDACCRFRPQDLPFLSPLHFTSLLLDSNLKSPYKVQRQEKEGGEKKKSMQLDREKEPITDHRKAEEEKEGGEREKRLEGELRARRLRLESRQERRERERGARERSREERERKERKREKREEQRREREREKERREETEGRERGEDRGEREEKR
ncbi:Zinc finger CCCH domain-containing protein 13, partial [Ophiophagus hannah]